MTSTGHMSGSRMVSQVCFAICAIVDGSRRVVWPKLPASITPMSAGSRAAIGCRPLLASAGFMPGRIESLFANEPVLSEVLGLLQDGSVPDEVRDDVRRMISLLVRQAQRASYSSPAGAHGGAVVAA